MRGDNRLASKRVVAYARISSDIQDKGSENQEETIKRYAERNGITILEWHKDNEGQNPRGDGKDRPHFQRMHKDAQAGKFDAVLVAYQERLGLIGHWFGYWAARFGECGVSLWDCEGRNLSSADPAMIERTARDTADSTGWLIKHSKKMLEARATSGRNGDCGGGVPPYYCDVVCYDSDLTRIKYRLVYHDRTHKTQIIYKDNGEEADRRHFSGQQHPHKDRGDRLRLAPTIEEEKLRITRDIFRWFNGECIEYGQIAGRLNRQGTPAYYSRWWTTTGIKSILTNSAVIGRPAQCKRTVSKYAERRDGSAHERDDIVIGAKGKCVKCDPDEWATPDQRVFDPIVPEDVFQAVQDKFASRRQGSRKPSRKAKAWLKGFLFCGGCNHQLNAGDRHIKGKGGKFNKVPSYRCSTYQSRGGAGNPYGCHTNHVKASVVEELVERYLLGTQQQVGFDAEVTAGAPSIAVECVPPSFDEPDTQARERLLAEVEALEADNGKIWDTAKRLDSPSAFDKAKAEMKDNDRRIAEKRDELARLGERVTKEVWERQRADALTTIREGTDRAKKEALSKVLERIDCYFDHQPGGKGHRLVKVVFTPVTVRYKWDDTAEQVTATRAKQERLLAPLGSQDGIETGTRVDYEYIGHIGKDNPRAIETEAGRAYRRELLASAEVLPGRP